MAIRESFLTSQKRKLEEQRKQKGVTDTDSNVNRIRSVVDSLTGTENADDIMLELLEVLQESGKVPQAGKFYVFVYNAKTNNLRYDQNPFVAVTEVYQWGFKGINFHWGEVRQYTWNEVAGSLYEVYASEIKDLQTLPFANFRLNSQKKQMAQDFFTNAKFGTDSNNQIPSLNLGGSNALSISKDTQGSTTQTSTT